MPDLGGHIFALLGVLTIVTPQQQHWLDPYLCPSVGYQSVPEINMCYPGQAQVMCLDQGGIYG